MNKRALKNPVANQDTVRTLATQQSRCPLCGRQISLTFHHLIPRKMHRRNHFRRKYDRQTLQKGIYICRACHSGIHRLYDEMRLAKEFCTIEAIKGDEAIQRHCNWVAKQKTQG